MFPKIPNIFQFLMLSYFHKFYLTIITKKEHWIISLILHNKINRAKYLHTSAYHNTPSGAFLHNRCYRVVIFFVQGVLASLLCKKFLSFIRCRKIFKWLHRQTVNLLTAIFFKGLEYWTICKHLAIGMGRKELLQPWIQPKQRSDNSC